MEQNTAPQPPADRPKRIIDERAPVDQRDEKLLLLNAALASFLAESEEDVRAA